MTRRLRRLPAAALLAVPIGSLAQAGKDSGARRD